MVDAGAEDSPSDRSKQPGVLGVGAGGASGPTGATSSSSPGAAAQGPQELLRPTTPGAAAGRARQGMFGTSGSGDTSGFGRLRLPAYAPPPAERPFGGWFETVTDARLVIGYLHTGLPVDRAPARRASRGPARTPRS